MRYEIVFAIAVAVASCAEKRPSTSASLPLPARIGNDPTFYVSSVTDTAASSGVIASVDTNVGRLHVFGIEDLKLRSSLALPFVEAGMRIIAGKDGAYFLALGQKQYAIFGPAGVLAKTPVALTGNIVSVALKERTLVLVDDLSSVALLRLGEDGAVEKSWLGGPVIGDGAAFKVGALLDEYRLLLLTQKDLLATVDVAASIDQQAWQYESAQIFGVNDAIWLAPTGPDSRFAMVLTPEKLVVFDLVGQKSTDLKTFESGSVISYGEQAVPHVLLPAAPDAATVKVWLANDDGTIAETLLGSGDMADSLASFDFVSTWLKPDRSEILGVIRPSYSENFFGSRVVKVRLSDGLFLENRELNNAAKIALLPDSLFLQYDSPLGAVELQKLGTTEKKELKGFNLPYLTEK